MLFHKSQKTIDFQGPPPPTCPRNVLQPFFSNDGSYFSECPFPLPSSQNEANKPTKRKTPLNILDAFSDVNFWWFFLLKFFYWEMENGHPSVCQCRCSLSRTIWCSLSPAVSSESGPRLTPPSAVLTGRIYIISCLLRCFRLFLRPVFRSLTNRYLSKSLCSVQANLWKAFCTVQVNNNSLLLNIITRTGYCTLYYGHNSQEWRIYR